MLSAWPAAAEAFERAITEDSDVALANIARARIHCFYQQGETARKAAVAARAKVARRDTAREEPCRQRPLVRPDPSTARKSRLGNEARLRRHQDRQSDTWSGR